MEWTPCEPSTKAGTRRRAGTKYSITMGNLQYGKPPLGAYDLTYLSVPSMFSTLGSEKHSRRKRMMTHVYSKSYIFSSAAARAQSKAILLERLLPLLRREAMKSDSRGSEVQSIFMATSMDLISSYIFGLKNSTDFLQDKTYRSHWLQLYLSRHHHHFWPQELPLLTSVCGKLGYRLYPPFVDSANEEIRQWNKNMCDSARSMLKNEREVWSRLVDQPVVFKALHEGFDKEERVKGEGSLLHNASIKQRDIAVASEILDQVLAGHETAGIVLTYIAWRLSQSPDLQAQLREELLSIKASLQIEDDAYSELPDAKELDSLPVLNAVVKETLRLHAPIPGPQPRTTPYPFCQIDGYTIPGGVRIASLAHTLHLDDRVFSGARCWDPSRWLVQESGGEGDDADDADERRKKMNRQFWAFGSGGRMCVGSNFALTGIKNVVAVIYANFKTEIVNDDGMEQTDGYSSRPKCDELHLKFVPLWNVAR
ncbi:hypothetical protein QQS21_003573 [Conoideocrella luteorostrata]|uniref:Cytochrome P450 n=1 Tax=Conoideocrella luteorostrata TaxID=1105319 RepID=A0AAJ0CVX8_9HYPO|nr:hypothetical protein QQS21_003573 [Conoideocrella luteorostrata]